MSLSKYVLRGKIAAAKPQAVGTGGIVELLAWLDPEAEKTTSDALAMVRRQYLVEVRKKGWDIDWSPPVLALPAPEVKNSQLLFSFPGVKVFELSVTE